MTLIKPMQTAVEKNSLTTHSFTSIMAQFGAAMINVLNEYNGMSEPKKAEFSAEFVKQIDVLTADLDRANASATALLALTRRHLGTVQAN